MTVKDLRVIYDAIWNAKSAIENLACENYPHTPFIDSRLNDMFYELNSMNVKLSAMMEEMKEDTDNV